jgi:aryl-alcohol dehydrogenase-like predicted oxidoreductase
MKVNSIIGLARSNKIDIIDTAIAYAQSEACVGQIGVSDYKVITKLPALPESFTDVGRSVREQIPVSLRRLNMMAVYNLLLHRSNHE